MGKPRTSRLATNYLKEWIEFVGFKTLGEFAKTIPVNGGAVSNWQAKIPADRRDRVCDVLSAKLGRDISIIDIETINPLENARFQGKSPAAAIGVRPVQNDDDKKDAGASKNGNVNGNGNGDERIKRLRQILTDERKKLLDSFGNSLVADQIITGDNGKK